MNNSTIIMICVLFAFSFYAFKSGWDSSEREVCEQKHSKATCEYSLR